MSNMRDLLNLVNELSENVDAKPGVPRRKRCGGRDQRRPVRRFGIEGGQMARPVAAHEAKCPRALHHGGQPNHGLELGRPLLLDPRGDKAGPSQR